MRAHSLRPAVVVAPFLLSLGIGCAGTTESDDESLVRPLASSVDPAGANPGGGSSGGTTDPCNYIPTPPGPGPGDADPSFGCLGTASHGTADSDYQIRGLAVQSDDKIIAVGSVSSGTNSDVWVARFSANGKLDATFATGGMYTKNFTAPLGGMESAEAVTVQPDGHIVVVGGFQTDNGIDKAGFLIRLGANGFPDPGFGVGGTVLLTGKTTWARGIVVQPHDQIAFAGENCPGNGVPCAATMGRFHGITGAPDLVFAPGTGGVVSTRFGGTGSARAYGLTGYQYQDQVVLAGVTQGATPGTDIGAMKFNGNVVATSFGTNGMSTYNTLSWETAYGISAGPTGGYLLAEAAPLSASFAIRKISYDGVQSTSWGTNGRALASFAGTGAASYAALGLPNALVAAAGVATTSGGKSRMAVARFNPQGVLDPSFSGDGQATFTARADNSWGNAIARQSTGKLIVAGWSRDDAAGSKMRAAMVRVLF